MIWEIVLAVSAVYAVSIVLLSIIALRGPTLGDQVIAIDAITYMTAVLMVLFSLFFKEPILTVVVIPLALWIYALDIYVAKYLERGDLGA